MQLLCIFSPFFLSLFLLCSLSPSLPLCLSLFFSVALAFQQFFLLSVSEGSDMAVSGCMCIYPPPPTLSFLSPLLVSPCHKEEEE